jgi:hypothetical protein
MDFMITAILAYLLYLFLEAPSSNLIKIMETNDSKPVDSNINEDLFIYDKNLVNGNNFVSTESPDENNDTKYLNEKNKEENPI